MEGGGGEVSGEQEVDMRYRGVERRREEEGPVGRGWKEDRCTTRSEFGGVEGREGERERERREEEKIRGGANGKEGDEEGVMRGGGEERGRREGRRSDNERQLLYVSPCTRPTQKVLPWITGSSTIVVDTHD